MPQMLRLDGEYPAVKPTAKFWRFLVTNEKKLAVKHSIGKPLCLISSICLQPFVQDFTIDRSGLRKNKFK